MHLINPFLPILSVRKVENEQTLMVRCPWSPDTMLNGEFQMIGCVWMANDEAVEAIVPLKGAKQVKAQTIAIEAFDCIEVAT